MTQAQAAAELGVGDCHHQEALEQGLSVCESPHEPAESGLCLLVWCALD